MIHKNIFIFTFIFLLITQIGLNTFFQIKIDNSFLYMFYFCFAFFIIYVIDKTDEKFTIGKYDLSDISIAKYFILFILFILLIIYTNYNIVSESIFFFFIFSILFKVDSRISFLIALIFISLTIVNLIISNEKQAEIFSIYTYYMLVVGVIVGIFENIEIKKVNSLENKINENE